MEDLDLEQFRTFREDYNFWGADEGEIKAAYKGRCTKCGLSAALERSDGGGRLMRKKELQKILEAVTDQFFRLKQEATVQQRTLHLLEIRVRALEGTETEPGPGPIEQSPQSQAHFKQHGRWPDAVVDERMAIHEASLAAARCQARRWVQRKRYDDA